MKNFLLGLNVLLIIAVASLFYLQFSSKNNSSISAHTNYLSNSNFKIAYFEMDSIENNYEYLKEVRNELRKIEQTKTEELTLLKNKNKAKLQAYQKKGNTMTQEEIARANEELMRLENELKTQEQIKMGELQDESIKKMQVVKKTIEDYLAEYNKDKHFAYILSSSSDLIYLKDTAFDITSEILKGLNNNYKNNK